MPAPVLSLSDLATHYDTPRGPLRAVDGVSFDLAEGETAALVGESGCGKSTLGRAVLRLAPATRGRIAYRGRDVTAAAGSELRGLRRRMQMVFQDPFASLNPRHRVGEILRTPLLVHGVPRAEAEDRVREVAARVGLPSDAAGRFPHEFSGGQRQRIGVARALVLRPDLVILDEPVSALDLSIQAQVLNLLAETKRDFGLSYLFISHDLSVVRYIADRVLVMYLGRIVEDAPHASFWARPRHPYAQALVAAVPDPARRRQAAPVQGELPSPQAVPPGCRFHPRCLFATDLCRAEDPALRALAPAHRVACHHAEALA